MYTSRLGFIIKKEFLRVRRDPAIIRLLIVAPLLQLLLFGYAATNDVRNVPVAICDADRSADSRLLTSEVAANWYFRLVAQPSDPRDIERLLLSGKATIAVYLPRNLSADLAAGRQAQVGLYVDGSDSNTAGVATAYLVALLRDRGLRWQIRQARREGLYGEQLPTLVAEQRVWYNPELKSANYMVPGIFGMILLVITVNLSSLAIVREREAGTLEQLMVTPLRPGELILGKMAPLGLIAFLESGLIVLLAVLWFHVPLRGNLALLFGMAAVFLVANLGLGLLISVVSRTQQEAQITSFLFIMPNVLLSGFMFPIQNMPQAVQYATCVIPFRYFLQIVRGLFLKGVGVEVLWPQMLVLALLAATLLGLGIRLMRKRL